MDHKSDQRNKIKIMRKIAILTRRAGYNMGSTLQAYAMCKMLSKFGCNVEILKYDEYARFLTWRIKPFLFNFLNKLPFISQIKFINKRFPLERIFAQQEKFKQFEASYFPLSTEKYRNSDDLKKTIGKYDIYVCGSDQIWSPMMYDPVFFLDFISDQPALRTIAYAPSLGVTNVCAISDEAKKLIKRINFISCREKEGADVLSEIIGSKVPVVLDPTLMLDKADWESVKSAHNLTNKQEYILTYFLHTRFYKNNIPNRFIDRLRKQTGLQVINIQMYNMEQIVNADEHIYEAGPADFITLISNATYIVTNSFHCCVFSYIFSKRFFVFEKFRKNTNTDNQNPRLYTLLETTNRQEALITDEECDLDLSFYPAKNNNSDLFITKKNNSMSFIKKALQ